MGTRILTKKSFLNFIFALAISYLITMSWDVFFARKNIGEFVYFLIYGIPKAIILSGIIYFAYLFLVFYFLRKMNNNKLKWYYMILLSSIFFSFVLLLDWLFLRDLYHTFFEFIRDVNFLLIFTFVSIIQINITLARSGIVAQ